MTRTKKTKRPRSLWEEWSDAERQSRYETALKCIRSLEHACVDYQDAILGYESVIRDLERKLERQTPSSESDE